MATYHPVARRSYTIGIAGLLSLATTPVFAAGFALIEQSVSSMGTAYAGAGSIAQDASTVYFNPASMSRLDGRQLSAGLHVVIPKTEFTGNVEYNPSHPAFNPPSPAAGLNGVDIAPGADNDADAGTVGALPHFTYVQELNNKWNFGFTVNVPFGLKTEYGSGWVGRYSAVDGEIRSVNLNPNLSFKVDDHVTLAFGVSALYTNLIFQAASDVGLNALLAGSPIGGWVPGSSTYDLLAKYDIDDWGFGWNFGALLEPTEHTRLGIAYRSKVEVELEGDLTTTNPAALGNTNAFSDVSLPDTLLLSAYHEVNPQWAVMADIMWTGWSRLDALVLRTPNQTTPAPFNNTIPLKWEDTFRYAIGASYKHDDRWTFRGGLAFDESPIPSPEYRLAALPDEDRTWLTFGAGYRYSKKLSLDFGYAHLFIDDTSINSTDAYTSLSPVVEGFHRITGEYDASVDIISAQANWKF